MPKKEACTNYFECSLPKEKQTPYHMGAYHDPRPVEIIQANGQLHKIWIHRDPAQEMYFPCPHPKCDHISILRSNPARHQYTCPFIQWDLQCANIIPSNSVRFMIMRQVLRDQQAAKAVAAPCQPVQKNHLSVRRRVLRERQPNQRSLSVALPLETPSPPGPAENSDSGDSLSPPNSSVYSDEDEDKDEDADEFDSTTPHPPAQPNVCLPVATFNQILANLDHFANTVNQLSTQFNRQTGQIEQMSETMEKVEAQISALRSQNARLEASIKSIEDDMDTAMHNLLDMWEDNEELEKELEGLLAEIGQAGNTQQCPITLG